MGGRDEEARYQAIMSGLSAWAGPSAEMFFENWFDDARVPNKRRFTKQVDGLFQDGVEVAAQFPGGQ